VAKLLSVGRVAAQTATSVDMICVLPYVIVYTVVNRWAQYWFYDGEMWVYTGDATVDTGDAMVDTG